MGNMSGKNWKNGHYGDYENPYNIRFGFYKSGRPKIELHKWEERNLPLICSMVKQAAVDYLKND